MPPSSASCHSSRAEQRSPVRVCRDGPDWQLTRGDRRITATAIRAPDGRMDIVLDDVRELVSVVRVGDTITVRRDGETWRLQLPDPIAAAAEEDDAGGRLVAPIPGQVTEVAARAGNGGHARPDPWSCWRP